MKILFVCTGNTCRSCMAEIIFNKLCDIQDVFAYSAGISVTPNSQTSENTALLLKEYFNEDIVNRKAVQITREMVEEADVIFTMTSYMKNILVQSLSEQKDRIFTLNEYVGDFGDILDPFGADIAIYKNTYEQLKKNISLLLDKLKEDKGISY